MNAFFVWFLMSLPMLTGIILASQGMGWLVTVLAAAYLVGSVSGFIAGMYLEP